MNTSPLKSYRFAVTPRRTLASVAATLGVDKTTVMRWEAKGVPLERLIEVERATGIPRHVLRPDIFVPAPLPKTRGSNSAVAVS